MDTLSPTRTVPEFEGLRVVAVGGGTGLSTLLRGLKRHVLSLSAIGAQPAPAAPYISRLTGIVTVTDDGGSSGRLRKELGVPPPGDIRNCMTALSDDEELLSQLFRYRFESGDLEGHSFGNLFLSALAGVCGDFALAVKLSSAILKTRGEIYPSSSNSNLQLDALMRNGQRVRGETNITASQSGIAHLRLVPDDAQPLPQALEAIEQADVISFGPGSLFTSIIPNLLVKGVPQAVQRSRALKVYVGNLMTQPNESTGLSASQHIQAIFEHAREKVFDYAMLNFVPVPAELRQRYADEGSEPMHNDLDAIRKLGVTPILGDYLDASHFARHATDRLANDLLNLPARLCQAAEAAK
ncbi:MAG: YvcK family protein [Acidobacteriota bacterium]|nr:YvcK family protein [Acidobacteriota bacterium]